MFAEDFVQRLIQLRKQKGVSARDMSLSIGQNPNYIFSIETGRMLPSMSVFFYICDFLHITPCEFFDIQTPEPDKLRETIKNLKKLDIERFNNINAVIANLAN